MYHSEEGRQDDQIKGQRTPFTAIPLANLRTIFLWADFRVLCILFVFGIFTQILQGCFPRTSQTLKSTDWSKATTDAAGALVQMDSTRPHIYLIFSGHDHNEGRTHVLQTLQEKNIKASFFFTGDFYRNPENREFIHQSLEGQHYLGPHSDGHLLYADWSQRDSTLVSRDSFMTDLESNYQTMETLFGITRRQASVFLPPYEWYNIDIVEWSTEMDLKLINLTSGSGTARDYTWPQMGSRYTPSEAIIRDLMAFESEFSLNGAIVLIHLGTDPRRIDKLYTHLGQILDNLSQKGYKFHRF